MLPFICPRLMCSLALALRFGAVAGLDDAKTSVVKRSPQNESGAPAVVIRMWVVSFDPSIDRAKLPLDLDALARDAGLRGPLGLNSGSDGRIQTNGLASKVARDKLAVNVGGYSLTMLDGSLVSGGGDSSGGASPPWQILAAPAVTALVGQPASISVGQPVSYLEPRGDGCLVLKQADDRVEGISIEMVVERASEKDVRFGRIDLKLSRVTGREPIPGIPFEVGRPIIDSRETTLGLTADPEKVSIIPLPQNKEDAPILVFLTAKAAAN